MRPSSVLVLRGNRVRGSRIAPVLNLPRGNCRKVRLRYLAVAWDWIGKPHLSREYHIFQWRLVSTYVHTSSLLGCRHVTRCCVQRRRVTAGGDDCQLPTNTLCRIYVGSRTMGPSGFFRPTRRSIRLCDMYCCRSSGIIIALIATGSSPCQLLHLCLSPSED